MKKLPFESNAQIRRYLWEIIRLDEQFFVQNMKRVISIDRYSSKQRITDKSEININEFWNHLEKIRAVEYLTTSKNNLSFVTFPKIENSNPLAYPEKEKIKILNIEKIKALFNKIAKPTPVGKDAKKIKKTKTIRLDKRNYLLNINKGQEIILFTSDKDNDGTEKETKQFKILVHLWEFRRELKKGKLVQEGDFEPIKAVKISSGSKSDSATRRTISRLNEIFEKKRVPIKIEIKRERSRLIVELD